MGGLVSLEKFYIVSSSGENIGYPKRDTLSQKEIVRKCCISDSSVITLNSSNIVVHTSGATYVFECSSESEARSKYYDLFLFLLEYNIYPTFEDASAIMLRRLKDAFQMMGVEVSLVNENSCRTSPKDLYDRVLNFDEEPSLLFNHNKFKFIVSRQSSEYPLFLRIKFSCGGVTYGRSSKVSLWQPTSEILSLFKKELLLFEASGVEDTTLFLKEEFQNAENDENLPILMLRAVVFENTLLLIRRIG